MVRNMHLSIKNRLSADIPMNGDRFPLDPSFGHMSSTVSYHSPTPVIPPYNTVTYSETCLIYNLSLTEVL